MIITKEKKIATIVAQDFIKSDTTFCPFCLSEDLVENGTMTTLLGWTGQGDNPNHRWTPCECRKCGEKFTFERKSGYCWVTQNDKSVAGISVCYEKVDYDCNRCQGQVSRRYTNLDGSKKTNSVLSTKMIDGKFQREYREFWACNVCGQEVET